MVVVRQLTHFLPLSPYPPLVLGQFTERMPSFPVAGQIQITVLVVFIQGINECHTGLGYDGFILYLCISEVTICSDVHSQLRATGTSRCACGCYTMNTAPATRVRMTIPTVRYPITVSYRGCRTSVSDPSVPAE